MKRSDWMALFVVMSFALPSAASTCLVSTGARLGPPANAGDFCDSVPGVQPIGDDWDSPQDQYANQCDADFDQDCFVGISDFLLAFPSPVPCPVFYYKTDLDLSGCTNLIDFSIFAPMFGYTVPQ